MDEDGDYWVEDVKNYKRPTEFAESIRETIEASVESYLPNSGFLTDLVCRGLHNVNWLEIANHLMNKREADD
jgi:hypothetical protein